MYSIKPYTKKKYITPIIEFEMMEEEVSVMAGSPDYVEGGGPNGEGTDDPFGAKRSDFIFDDNWDTPSEQSQSNNENNGAW